MGNVWMLYCIINNYTVPFKSAQLKSWIAEHVQSTWVKGPIFRIDFSAESGKAPYMLAKIYFDS